MPGSLGFRRAGRGVEPAKQIEQGGLARAGWPSQDHQLAGVHLEFGIQPGPRLGELLGEIDEARFAGELSTPAQAVEWARERLAGRG